MNSCQKGKRIERELAKLFREHGFTARRGQQYCGAGDSPDVVVEELPGFHVESKGGRKILLKDWLAQVRADCKGKDWAVFYKQNREEFLAILPASVLIELIKQSGQYKDKDKERK